MGLMDLSGDPESKGGGVTGRVILECALKKILPQILEGHSDLIFMQDGAKIHQRKELIVWLKEKSYKLMRSLDLNQLSTSEDLKITKCHLEIGHR